MRKNPMDLEARAASRNDDGSQSVRRQIHKARFFSCLQSHLPFDLWSEPTWVCRSIRSLAFNAFWTLDHLEAIEMESPSLPNSNSDRMMELFSDLCSQHSIVNFLEKENHQIHHEQTFSLDEAVIARLSWDEIHEVTEQFFLSPCQSNLVNVRRPHERPWGAGFHSCSSSFISLSSCWESFSISRSSKACGTIARCAALGSACWAMPPPTWSSYSPQGRFTWLNSSTTLGHFSGSNSRALWWAPSRRSKPPHPPWQLWPSHWKGGILDTIWHERQTTAPSSWYMNVLSTHKHMTDFGPYTVRW